MMLLLGGTGLLGGHVLRKLREERHPVRLYSRGSRDWRDASVQDVRQKGAELVIADALDLEKLSKAAEGCTAIINLIGAMPPRAGTDMKAVHVQVVKNILKIAEEHHIQRFIHLSCLGADGSNPGDYFRTKYEADKLVRKAELYWTILRPSYLFGDRFPFLEALMPMIRFPICMPIVGSGQYEIQPVHAEDVASCLVSALYDRETVGKEFDLAGPDTFTIQELMELARKAHRMTGSSMNIPAQTASSAADNLGKWLPRASLNVELIQLMLSNSTTDENALTSYFKREPLALSDCFQKVVSAR